jgi:hypothetical protein
VPPQDNKPHPIVRRKASPPVVVYRPGGHGLLFRNTTARNRFFLSIGLAVWDRSLTASDAADVASAMLAEVSGRAAL